MPFERDGTSASAITICMIDAADHQLGLLKDLLSLPDGQLVFVLMRLQAGKVMLYLYGVAMITALQLVEYFKLSKDV